MIEFHNFEFVGIYMEPSEITDENLKQVKKLGISAVFAPLKDKLPKKVKKHALKFYSVKWTFKALEPGNTAYLIKTLSGKRVAWGFKQTGCPNNLNVLDYALKEITHHITNNPEAAGLVLDATRFPSPLEGLETYFSCFCKHCQNQAEKHGINLEEVRLTLKNLLKRERMQKFENFLKETNYQTSLTFFLDFLHNYPDVYKWLEFKEKTVTEKTKLIYENIKNIKCSLEVGHFLFTPSLAPLVGQNYRQISKYADFITPMIYTTGDNLACIDGEIRGLINILQKLLPNTSKETLIKLVRRITGITFRVEDEKVEVEHETIYREARKAKLLATVKIYPTIFTVNKSDVQIKREVKEARREADEIILFKYDKQLFTQP